MQYASSNLQYIQLTQTNTAFVGGGVEMKRFVWEGYISYACVKKRLVTFYSAFWNGDPCY